MNIYVECEHAVRVLVANLQVSFVRDSELKKGFALKCVYTLS
jgi:hypothetical protein